MAAQLAPAAVPSSTEAAERRYTGECRGKGLPLTAWYGWRLRIDPGVDAGHNHEATGWWALERAAGEIGRVSFGSRQEIWEHGQKDPHTGVVTSMGINEAKEKFLGQQVKANTGPEAEQAAAASKLYYTDSSSGRRATEKRR